MEQYNCQHDNIAEYPCTPAIRVCRCCGIAEEGDNFMLLNNDIEIPHIDRAGFVKSIRGFYLCNIDKERVLRNEVTLEQLIMGSR